MFPSTDDDVGKRALLAGGGSGGHVFPALAVADELVERGWQVSFAGTAEGMEARLAASRGFDFHPLAALAVRGRGLGQRWRAARVVMRSTLQARSLVRRLGAVAVVATGGYACVPAALGGFLARRPLLLVEPNAMPGLANRFLSFFAKQAAVAWDETGGHLHCPTERTGVPVRREFFAVEAPTTLSGEIRLLVLGGSQGAQALNRVIPRVLETLSQTLDLRMRVVHQAGRGKVEETRAGYQAGRVDAEVVAFLEDVPSAMSESDLVLSRAGAITLAEICAAGRPALLFPLALAGAHQLQNARALERVGAAEVVEPEGLEPERLIQVLTGLLEDSRLLEMAHASRALAAPDAASRIADQLEGMVGGR